jgi:dTMP kinase
VKGLFITFEGIEGSGKTTQIKRLRNWFIDHGYETVITREPGGTIISEAIRSVLLNPDHDTMVSSTELLLYAAARAQHVEELIKPALESGVMVLCDRYSDSTVAYQGYGRGVTRTMLDQLNRFATGGLEPDVTLLFDLDVHEGLQRALRGRLADRIEQESVDFHERVRNGYLDLAREFPDRFVVIPAEQAADAVAIKVIESVQHLVIEKKQDG